MSKKSSRIIVSDKLFDSARDGLACNHKRYLLNGKLTKEQRRKKFYVTTNQITDK
jgi:hypothetical protein